MSSYNWKWNSQKNKFLWIGKARKIDWVPGYVVESNYVGQILELTEFCNQCLWQRLLLKLAAGAPYHFDQCMIDQTQDSHSGLAACLWVGKEIGWLGHPFHTVTLRNTHLIDLLQGVQWKAQTTVRMGYPYAVVRKASQSRKIYNQIRWSIWSPPQNNFGLNTCCFLMFTHIARFRVFKMHTFGL